MRALNKVIRGGAAQKALERQKKTRLEILQEAATTRCACIAHFQEEGRLLRFMRDIVAKIPGAASFQAAVIDALSWLQLNLANFAPLSCIGWGGYTNRLRLTDLTFSSANGIQC